MKKHISEQGANANCAQVNEIASSRRGHAPHRDKQRHIDRYGQSESKEAMEKQAQHVNKGCKCNKCGRMHTEGDRCATHKAECRKCKKLGHFAVVCCSRVVNKITAPDGEDDSQVHFLGEITDVNDSNDAWTAKLPTLGKEIVFRIDTGADTTVISDQLSHKPKLRIPVSKLDSLRCIGYFTATTRWKEKEFRLKVNMIKDPSHLLGCNVAIAMGLVKTIGVIEIDTSSIDYHSVSQVRLKYFSVK